MSGWWRRRTAALRADPEGGAALTIWVLVMSLAVLLMAGLAVDGGAQLRSAARAERTATEAARAGLQAYSLTGEADTEAAIAAAERYLSAADTDHQLVGTVAITADNEITVDVTVTVRTAFLGLVGINDVSAKGSGRAQLVRSVDGG